MNAEELDLDALRELSVLDDLDVHFARALERIAEEREPRVTLALALLSRQVRAGHVCLALRELAERLPEIETESGPRALAWPEPEAWLDALHKSALLGEEDADTPLYLDAAGRLYLRRYFDYERSLARSLLERVAQPIETLDPARVEASLARLFGAAPGRAERARSPRRRAVASAQLELFIRPESHEPAAPDLQRRAAERVAVRAFTVITGGPGTGKTSTVVKLLALLCEAALFAGKRAPRTLLLAPTGKAAARLSEAIRRAKRELDCGDEVLRAISEEASTIHRALGIGRDGRGPRYDRKSPLAADVVVVDEASMVDLSLMARLCEAVPRKARLVLLGDKNQLASVEAGAVLGDICGAGASTKEAAPIASSIVELTRSYRYLETSGIRKLALAIEAGAAARVLEILRDKSLPDVALVELAPDAPLPPQFLLDAEQRFSAFLDARDASSKLAALEHFRVLCAHRRGPYGQLAVNVALEAALRRNGRIAARAERYPGRPILVTANDREARLYNGDVGVLWQSRREPERLVACFAGSAGELRELSTARLPPHEPVYAMSVHKSQGSEFDEVAVLLSTQLSPVLSRELLYTAVTRAKQRVVLWASAEAIMRSVAHAIDRSSGLYDALWR